MKPEPTRMYNDGPIRMFSTERFLGALPYSDGVRKGFVGAHVCTMCKKPAREVLGCSGGWHCAACVLLLVDAETDAVRWKAKR